MKGEVELLKILFTQIELICTHGTSITDEQRSHKCSPSFLPVSDYGIRGTKPDVDPGMITECDFSQLLLNQIIL